MKCCSFEHSDFCSGECVGDNDPSLVVVGLYGRWVEHQWVSHWSAPSVIAWIPELSADFIRPMS